MMTAWLNALVAKCNVQDDNDGDEQEEENEKNANENEGAGGSFRAASSRWVGNHSRECRLSPGHEEGEEVKTLTGHSNFVASLQLLANN